MRSFFIRTATTVCSKLYPEVSYFEKYTKYYRIIIPLTILLPRCLLQAALLTLLRQLSLLLDRQIFL